MNHNGLFPTKYIRLLSRRAGSQSQLFIVVLSVQNGFSAKSGPEDPAFPRSVHIIAAPTICKEGAHPNGSACHLVITTEVAPLHLSWGNQKVLKAG